jgi:hypothetical protein
MRSYWFTFLALALTPMAGAKAQMTTAHVDSSVIGMPIVAADGVQIGRVTSIGTLHGDNAMVGEVEQRLGFGGRLVLIPEGLASVHGDRVHLAISSDRISELQESPGPRSRQDQ